jgi:hypothetical protein
MATHRKNVSDEEIAKEARHLAEDAARWSTISILLAGAAFTLAAVSLLVAMFG